MESIKEFAKKLFTFLLANNRQDDFAMAIARGITDYEGVM